MQPPTIDAEVGLCVCGHGVESHGLTDSLSSPSGVYCNEFVVIADGHFHNRQIQCPCQSFIRRSQPQSVRSVTTTSLEARINRLIDIEEAAALSTKT